MHRGNRRMESYLRRASVRRYDYAAVAVEIGIPFDPKQ